MCSIIFTFHAHTSSQLMASGLPRVAIIDSDSLLFHIFHYLDLRGLFLNLLHRIVIICTTGPIDQKYLVAVITTLGIPAALFHVITETLQ